MLAEWRLGGNDLQHVLAGAQYGLDLADLNSTKGKCNHCRATLDAKGLSMDANQKVLESDTIGNIKRQSQLGFAVVNRFDVERAANRNRWGAVALKWSGEDTGGHGGLVSFVGSESNEQLIDCLNSCFWLLDGRELKL
jgi:hypothetical protein